MTEVGADDRVRVNCGLQHPISLPVPDGRNPTEGERVTVRVSSRRPVRAKLVDEVPPGYAVDVAELDSALARDDAGLRIAASRHGDVISTDRLDELAAARAGAAGSFTVAFGAPERGLPAILGVEPAAVGATSENPGFDLWLNTVPDQGSEVVHTEEAVWATLALLSLTE